MHEWSSFSAALQMFCVASSLAVLMGLCGFTFPALFPISLMCKDVERFLLACYLPSGSSLVKCLSGFAHFPIGLFALSLLTFKSSLYQFFSQAHELQIIFSNCSMASQELPMVPGFGVQ